MITNPKWEDINKCKIWVVLGVSECNNCDTRLQCWGKDSDLPIEQDNGEWLKELLANRLNKVKGE